MQNKLWPQICAFLVLFSAFSAASNLPTEILTVRDETTRKYEPNWDSLDTRPLPAWFDKAKIGIFVHWGMYSVPGWGEWFWSFWKNGNHELVDFMKKNYPPNFTYQDFAPQFTAEFFNPQEWADLFEKSGAKYVVLTSKHHDGYTMWPSKYSFGWSVRDLGPSRDLVGELAAAVKMTNLKFGLYHSLFEWYNPLFEFDKSTNFSTQEFVDQKMIPEMLELVNTYKPWVFWSDGDWDASDKYFKSLEFLAWLYNESPVKNSVVTNDRWGIGIPCEHGDFYSCQDRFNPGVLQVHKWENAMTLDRASWGYRRNANLQDYLTTFELIQTLATTVSCGGNLLINVGPTKEGTIIPIFQERLTDLGKWLSVNGESIYNTKPWAFQNDTLTPDVWYTKKSDVVYAVVLFWPIDNIIYLQAAGELFIGTPGKVVTLLGSPEVLPWSLKDGVVKINFPDKSTFQGDWAFVLKFS